MNTYEKGFIKKKQSTSTALIGPFPKKKKKTGKRKSPKHDQTD
jgi:hypothetical protein